MYAGLAWMGALHWLLLACSVRDLWTWEFRAVSFVKPCGCQYGIPGKINIKHAQGALRPSFGDEL